ncbi:hypothetical protein VNI00_003921 [Paramarasmius palmivorus]|uniref:Transglutaminase-like domain-containing protein n=1 Tax=Paramarasmius palmivorus TaxID=297713 RepID=A0AAW0DPC7_9AGAR
MGSNKPRGLQAARKLRNDRRENRWADKAYKKRALGNVYKTSPTGGSSHAKGIVLEKVGVEAKQPNSAIRKCVRVQLIKNGKKVTAFVPNDGCLNFVDENDEVLISGFGRSGKAKGDIPGVRFKVVKVSGVGLLALWKEKKPYLNCTMSVKPSLPPRKAPPPLPQKRASTIGISVSYHNDQPEVSEKPLGIAARIASLQLNQVGLSPAQKRAKAPEPDPDSEEETDIVPQSQDEDLPFRTPQPTGSAFVRLIRRRPPPIPSDGEQEDADEAPSIPPPLPQRKLPPMPARLPTPPPEPELEPEPEPQYAEEYHTDHSAGDTCIKCHDFSFIDQHASQFPRHTVTSLDQLAYDLTSPWESETEKARAIFTWLHHNVAYDTESFFSGNLRGATPESTFQSGLAVCDGYAGLFVSLAEKAGLQAMKVTGHGKGFGYVAPDVHAPAPIYQGNHAWNCVLMDGDWRLVDSCWGAGALEGTAYRQRFAPVWFTSSNAEFGKRHYPEDPGYQLLTEDEGGPVSWENYILVPEGPVIFGDFYEHNFSPYFVQPDVKYIQGGTRVSFYIFKLCEHMSTAEEDNYVYFVNTPDDTRIPMTVDPETGGYTANVYIPRGEGEVSIFYVKEVRGRDAKGLGVDGFNAALGRAAMSFGGLCRWTVA